MDPGSSIHTFTSSNVPKKKDEDAVPAGATPRLTRLERANRAIEVMEKRLKANKQIRERCGHLEEKLDQLNKDMDTAYIRIKDELTRAELGAQSKGGSTTPVSASKTTSMYTTDYTEKSEIAPATSIPQPQPKLEPMLEQRLSCMERSLKRLDAIELALSNSRLDGPAPRTTPVPKMAGNLYGCHDISEIFSQTQTELRRARTAISRMLSMPAIYSKTQTVSECIRDRSELDVLGKMIDRFLVKLQNSKSAYQSACGDDSSNCILCTMETTSSWISRSPLY